MSVGGVNVADYDIETFQKDYSKNYKNPLKPFWNRAISGTYDIYVCFGGDGKSSNFLWFGLGYNDAYNEAQAEEITENVNE